MRRLLLLASLLFALPADAQFTDARAAFPAAPLGHQVWTPFSNERTKMVQQSGWNIPDGDVVSSHTPSESEPDKLAMQADVSTYRVGLISNSYTDLPYTMSNRGPANCAATNVCRCPLETTINGTEDLAGLPTVALSGGPSVGNGTYYLIKDCNFGTTTSVNVVGSLKVAFENVAAGYISNDQTTSGGSVVIVDSLVYLTARSSRTGSVFFTGGGYGLIAYSEVIALEDGLKIGSSPSTIYGPTAYAMHVHGFEDDTQPWSLHHDGIQCQGSVGGFHVLYSNIEAGGFRNTQQGCRCKGDAVSGLKAGNITYAKTHFNGGSQNSVTTGPGDDAGPNTFAGVGIAWDNRFLGKRGPGGVGDTSGPGRSWSNNGNPLAFESDWNAPAYCSGNLATDGNQTGTSPDGAWDTNGCKAGQLAVTGAQQTAITDYAGDIEDWVGQVRTAAGYSSTPTVSILSVTPSSPPTTSDLTVVWGTSGFTPSGAATVLGSGTNTISTADTGTVGTETLTAPPWNTGLTNVTVSVPGSGGPYVSAVVAVTFVTPPAADLDFVTTPGSTTTTSGTAIDLVVTPSGSATGNYDVLVDADGDGGFVADGTCTAVSGASCDTAIDPAFTADGSYSVRVVRQGITTTRTYDVTISGGVATNDFAYAWIWDATQPHGSQSLGDNGTVLFNGITYDLRVIGACARFGAVTTEQIGSYTGAGSLRVSVTGPGPITVVWDETNMPYVAPQGDSGWYDAGAGIPRANCGTSAVNTALAGAYTFVFTPYSSNTVGVSAGTPTTMNVEFARITTVPAAVYTTADTPVLNYVFEGTADSAVEADMDGNGSFEVNCNETANTCTASGPLAAGNYAAAIRANGDQVHHSVALPIAAAVSPATLGGWMLAP